MREVIGDNTVSHSAGKGKRLSPWWQIGRVCYTGAVTGWWLRSLGLPREGTRARRTPVMTNQRYFVTSMALFTIVVWPNSLLPGLPRVAKEIPTLSEWGLVMGVCLLSLGVGFLCRCH